MFLQHKLIIRWLMRNGFESCQICGISSNLTFDHIIPKSWGGSNELDNLCILCSACNHTKDNNYMDLKSLAIHNPGLIRIEVYDLKEGMYTPWGQVEAIGFLGNYKDRDMYSIEFSGENQLCSLMDGMQQRAEEKRRVKHGNVYSLPGDLHLALDPRYVLV